MADLSEPKATNATGNHVGKLSPQQFARAYFNNLGKRTANEKALRQAIADGLVTPDMSLREIARIAGLGTQPQLVRHYLDRFLKESTPDTSTERNDVVVTDPEATTESLKSAQTKANREERGKQ